MVHMNVVRSLFSNTTFNPLYVVNEQARVLSGEEEAIFDWTGVNFLLGDLLQDSLGSGTVVNPVRTHGALDLGGSSTQISFYEPNEDIMGSLFKLQIGQAKHWNVYTHSFLYNGMNDAITRFQSRLAAEKSADERLISGIYNPCLPGGTSVDIRTNIH
jgi:Golgi nucleoside diphosphatase